MSQSLLIQKHQSVSTVRKRTQVDQAKRMKELEKENQRLRRAVSDLTLDNQILKEVAQGKF